MAEYPVRGEESGKVALKALCAVFFCAKQSLLAASLCPFYRAFQFTLEPGQRMMNSSSVFGWAHDLRFIKGCVGQRMLKESVEVWGN